MFCKKGVLRNFAKLTGKYLYQRLYFVWEFQIGMLEGSPWEFVWEFQIGMFEGSPFEDCAFCIQQSES